MGPNFTLNYGARYDLTFPFVAENNSYSVGNWEDVFGVSGVGNLFKPGTLTGQAPRVPPAGGRRARLPDGLEQHLAQRRVRLDARRERLKLRWLLGRSRRLRRCAAATADRSRGWDSPTSPTRPRQQPRRRR